MNYDLRIRNFIRFLSDYCDLEELVSLEFIQAVVLDNFPENDDWIQVILNGNKEFPQDVITIATDIMVEDRLI